MFTRIIQHIRTSIYPHRWEFLGIGLAILPFASLPNAIVRISCLILGSAFLLLSILCLFPYFQEEIPLPKFELVLKKGLTQLEIDPFYSTFLSWTDFENEKIAIRKEVHEIISIMKKGNGLLVLGKPSSGKTVILNSVGYLLRRGKMTLFKPKVFLIELKKHVESNIVRYFDFIRETNRKIVVLIDDVHIRPALVNSLLIDIYGKKNIKITLCSRRIKTFTDTKTEFDYFFENKMSIRAETEIESMIEIFLNKSFHNQISDYKKWELHTYLREFKDDRWLLTQALMTLDINSLNISREKIYKKFKNKITQIQIEDRIINASEILLSIAIFSQYEIPLHKSFLKKIGVKESLLDDLIEINEIICEDNFVFLHHSKLAEFIIATHLHFSDVLKNVMLLKYETYDNLTFNLLLNYLYSFPEYMLDSINNLFSSNEFNILNRLLYNESFLYKFISQLDKEQNIWKLRISFQIFGGTQIDSSITSLMKLFIYLKILKFNINNLNNITHLKHEFNRLKLFQKETKFAESKRTIEDTSLITPLLNNKKCVIELILKCRLIFEELPRNIASKLNLQNNIQNIAKGIEELSQISSIFADLILNNVDFESISLYVEGLTEYHIVKEFLSDLSQNRKNIVHTIIPFINMNNIQSIIKREEDPWNIVVFIRNFSRWEMNETLKMIDIVSGKLNLISKIRFLGNSLTEISSGNRDIAIAILNKIPLKSLKEKIKSETSLSKISRFVGQISNLNYTTANSLLTLLLARIEKEYDFNNLSTSIYGLVMENSTFTGDMIRKLDSKKLFDIINKESDYNNLGILLGILSKTNEELMNSILYAISKKIENENNFRKISLFYINILATDVQLAFRISEAISRKIKNNYDNFQVQIFLKLVEHLNYKLYETIINSSKV